MGVKRRVNLFALELLSPAEDGQPPRDIPIRDAFQAIAGLSYDPDNLTLPSNRYYFKPGTSYRYSLDFNAFGPRLLAGTIVRSDTDGAEQEFMGRRTPLPLRRGHALSFPTHFLLDPERRTVLMESNGHGARYTDLARYLQSRLDGNMDVPVERCTLKPVVDQSVFDRFLREQGSLAFLDLIVTRSAIPEFRQSLNTGVLSEAERIVEAIEGVSRVSRLGAQVGLRIGRPRYAKSGGLGDEVKRGVVQLARRFSPDFTRLAGKVENRPDDSGATVAFDLLQARTSRVIEGIATTTTRNHIDSQDMFAKMAEVYSELGG